MWQTTRTPKRIKQACTTMHLGELGALNFSCQCALLRSQRAEAQGVKISRQKAKARLLQSVLDPEAGFFFLTGFIIFRSACSSTCQRSLHSPALSSRAASSWTPSGELLVRLLLFLHVQVPFHLTFSFPDSVLSRPSLPPLTRMLALVCACARNK